MLPAAVSQGSPSMPPTPAPSPVLEAHPVGTDSRRPGGHDGWQPPLGWPPLDQITYLKEAITTLLLLLTVPYVLLRLATRPGQLVSDLGRKHTRP